MFNLDGGLQKLADYSNIRRQGVMHQAGSDSLVTLQVFFAIFNKFESEKDRKDYINILSSFNLDVYGFSNDQAFISYGGSTMRAPINVYGQTVPSLSPS